jgi:hypothetical protein
MRGNMVIPNRDIKEFQKILIGLDIIDCKKKFGYLSTPITTGLNFYKYVVANNIQNNENKLLIQPVIYQNLQDAERVLDKLSKWHTMLSPTLLKNQIIYLN